MKIIDIFDMSPEIPGMSLETLCRSQDICRGRWRLDFTSHGNADHRHGRVCWTHVSLAPFVKSSDDFCIRHGSVMEIYIFFGTMGTHGDISDVFRCYPGGCILPWARHSEFHFLSWQILAVSEGPPKSLILAPISVANAMERWSEVGLACCGSSTA